jgi:ABC-type proline/glycine betaine transport system substrate-binding protein
LIDKPYDLKDIVLPLAYSDKANVAWLDDRVRQLEENQIAFAVTLTTGTSQKEDNVNIGSVSWQSSTATWTVTYNGPEPKRILAQADQRAGLDTPYTLVSLQHVSTSKQVLVRILEWDDSNRTWRAYNQEEPAKVYLLGLGVKE